MALKERAWFGHSGVALVLVVAAMVSIQSGAALAKRLFPLVGPAGTTTLRLTMAALLLAAVWRPWRGALTRRDQCNVALYGLSLGAMNLLFYFSLARIPLGIAVSLEFTGPLAVAILASRRPLDVLWAVLAAGGIVLILPFDAAAVDAGRLDPVGIAYALGAGLFWALYILFGQRAGAALHGGRAAALGMMVAAVAVAPVGAVQVGSRLLDWSLLPLGLVVAVFSSALPYSLEMVALQRLPAKSFGILMSLEPAVAALAGSLLLGELLTQQQWLAIAGVMAASLGTVLTAAKIKPVAVPA